MYPQRQLFSPFEISAYSKRGTTSANTRISTIEPYYRFESKEQKAFLEVEVPGVSKADISVEIKGHILTVTGTRYRASHWTCLNDAYEDVDSDNYQSSQSSNDDTAAVSQGAKRIPLFIYSLEVRLGQDAGVDQVSCLCFKDGILTLTVPALPKESPRDIPIP